MDLLKSRWDGPSIYILSMGMLHDTLDIINDIPHRGKSFIERDSVNKKVIMKSKNKKVRKREWESDNEKVRMRKWEWESENEKVRIRNWVRKREWESENENEKVRMRNDWERDRVIIRKWERMKKIHKNCRSRKLGNTSLNIVSFLNYSLNFFRGVWAGHLRTLSSEETEIKCQFVSDKQNNGISR